MTGKPKILMMLRLYHGFRDPLYNKQWTSSGVPAIYNILDALIKKSQCDIILYFYVPEKDKRFVTKKKLYLSELGQVINIKPAPFYFYYLPEKVTTLLTYIYFSMYSVVLAYRHQSNLFYTDRGNVLGAAFVHRLLKQRAVIRMLGMPGQFYAYVKKFRLLPILFRFAYRTKFDAIIGTQDGSSINDFIDKMCHRDTQKHIKLNGAFHYKFSNEIIGTTVKIIFIGRLENNKGINILLHAISKLDKHIHAIQVDIIGDGTQKKAMQELAQQLHIGHAVIFHGAMVHDDVVKKLYQYDIYISLNQSGQISNSNLEAIASGLCMIVSKTAPESDQIAKELGINDDTVCWIDNTENGDSLAQKLQHLLDEPALISAYKKATQQLAHNIPSINERIEWEVKFLENLATNTIDQ